MKDEELAAILATQSPSGAFGSTVYFGDRSCPDENGFTTALVLRALRGVPNSPRLQQAREGALAFLLSCGAPEPEGAYGFWPPGKRPAWCGPIPPDLDDTAVIALELARHGRLDRKALVKLACTLLLPYRLGQVYPPSPPWLRRGVFLTWMGKASQSNVVDCCVNANVVALLTYAGLEHLPGYEEACAMIREAIDWAGDSWQRARAIVPFYPHPGELLWAVRNGVDCGAQALQPALRELEALDWAQAIPDLQRPICGSAYGRIVWRCEGLMRARRSLMRPG